MSELQGPRIPGEEGSRRRRPLGWIIGGLIALLLLALLIPFACQALTGGSDPQGGGSETQERKNAQAAADAQGDNAQGGDENTGAGENTRPDPTGGNGPQDGEQDAAETDRAADSDAETSGERAGARAGGDLPETGGTSPLFLLAAGAGLIIATAGLSVLVRLRSASRG